MNDLQQILDEKKRRIDRAIADYLDALDAPRSLVDIMRYIILGDGKRVRPVFVLATAHALGGSETTAMPAAIALEFVHAYSLAHDDLPALDDDDERRGRPSAHRRFDEAGAILAGDALLTEAFALPTTLEGRLDAAFIVKIVASLSRAAGAAGMVGGQVIDIRHEARSASELRSMHAMKTGALFRCAMELGALAARASGEVVAACGRFGALFGAAFQLSDDLLDLDEAVESAHEQQVNLAFIEGTDAIRGEVAELHREAERVLASIDASMDLHRQMLRWVAARAERR